MNGYYGIIKTEECKTGCVWLPRVTKSTKVQDGNSNDENRNIATDGKSTLTQRSQMMEQHSRL